MMPVLLISSLVTSYVMFSAAASQLQEPCNAVVETLALEVVWADGEVAQVPNATQGDSSQLNAGDERSVSTVRAVPSRLSALERFQKKMSRICDLHDRLPTDTWRAQLLAGEIESLRMVRTVQNIAPIVSNWILDMWLMLPTDELKLREALRKIISAMELPENSPRETGVDEGAPWSVLDMEFKTSPFNSLGFWLLCYLSVAVTGVFVVLATALFTERYPQKLREMLASFEHFDGDLFLDEE